MLVIAAWMLAVSALLAQKATVERVEMTPTDLSASKYPRLDNNGEPCALVRVEVLADDVEFFGNVIQPVEHKTGDYWVYMLGGSKMLQIKSRSFLPVMINFADYGIDALLPKMTYVITLSLPAAATQQQSASSGMNYLVMTVNPANAKVSVDGKDREVRDGNVKAVLRHGTYAYHVEAPGYLPEDGYVTIGSERAECTVILRSNKGTLAVSTITPATEIYVNGERMGVGSWCGELVPDTYIVEGRLAAYRNAEMLVNVASGQHTKITLPSLTPVTGSLNVDYEPVGASISIDGIARGTTPAIFDNLHIGSHSVTIAFDGYTPQTLTAAVTEGQLTDLTGKLQTETVNVKYRMFHDKGRYGFIDKKGNIVIPAKYSDAGGFFEGLARVEVNGKYGFIDKNDNMVIPAKYDNTIGFSSGFAPVKVNGKWGLIDKSGNMVIPAKYNGTMSFFDGLARVEVNGKYGFVDINDTMVIPAKYDDAWGFSEELARIKHTGKYGFIDRNDTMVISAKYDDVRNFSEGLACVRINGKWGFIDRNDTMVIPARYDYIWDFSEGLACVRVNGKYGFIDRNDNLVILAKYDGAGSFSEGLAWVRVNGKYGFIDRNDNLVIPAKYDDVGTFSHGEVWVKLNGREFYIDKNGNEVK